jgi:hypothetical protein
MAYHDKSSGFYFGTRGASLWTAERASKILTGELEEEFPIYQESVYRRPQAVPTPQHLPLAQTPQPPISRPQPRPVPLKTQWVIDEEIKSLETELSRAPMLPFERRLEGETLFSRPEHVAMSVELGRLRKLSTSGKLPDIQGIQAFPYKPQEGVVPEKKPGLFYTPTHHLILPEMFVTAEIARLETELSRAPMLPLERRQKGKTLLSRKEDVAREEQLSKFKEYKEFLGKGPGWFEKSPVLTRFATALTANIVQQGASAMGYGPIEKLSRIREASGTAGALGWAAGGVVPLHLDLPKQGEQEAYPGEIAVLASIPFSFAVTGAGLKAGMLLGKLLGGRTPSLITKKILDPRLGQLGGKPVTHGIVGVDVMPRSAQTMPWVSGVGHEVQYGSAGSWRHVSSANNIPNISGADSFTADLLKTVSREGRKRTLRSGRVPGGIWNQKDMPEDLLLDKAEGLRKEADASLDLVTNPKPDPLFARAATWADELWTDFRIGVFDPVAPMTSLPRVEGASAAHAFQAVAGAPGRGMRTLEQFVRPVLQPVRKDIQFLKEYMSAQSLSDVLSKNPSAHIPKEFGRGRADLSARLDAIERAVGVKRFAAIKHSASELWKLSDEHILQRLLSEGMIDSIEYQSIKSVNPQYWPLVRDDFNNAIVAGLQRQKPSVTVPRKVLKRREAKGSTRKLSDDSFDIFLSNFLQVETSISANKANRILVGALEVAQRNSGTRVVRQVEPLKDKQNWLGTQQFMSADEFVHAGPFDEISFMKNGVKHVYEVPTIFANIAKGLLVEPDNILLKLTNLIGQPIRHGAVTYNPFFTPINVQRDAMSALFREKLIPFGPDYFVGLWAAFRKNNLYNEVANAGALQAGVTDVMRQTPKGINFGAIEVRSALDALLLIPRIVARVNNIFETGPRIATYRKLGRIKGLDPLERVIRTRDVTVDFAKMGNWMRTLNQVIPFSNAAVQGSANILRTIKDNPKWVAAVAGIMNVPTVMTRINNLRFETSALIPDYEYTRSWVLQFGEGTRRDGTKFPIYTKFPKGEFMSMFSFPVEALFGLSRETEDRSMVEILIDYGIEATKSVMPVDASLTPPVPFIGTAVGLETGNDLFTGRPIVPQIEEALMPEQQFGPETSYVAHYLGNLFNISPRKIDFLVKDFTAGLGQTSNWILSQALDAAGFRRPTPFGHDVAELPLEVAEKLSEIPGINRFFNTRDTQVTRREWVLYKKVYNDTTREFNKIPEMHNLGISLGSVRGEISYVPDASISNLFLTPGQQARYHQIYADHVLPTIGEFARNLKTLDPTGKAEERRGSVLAELSRLKALARERFKDELNIEDFIVTGNIPDPEIAEDRDNLAKAFVARKALVESGYWRVLQDNPIYADNKDRADTYDKWSVSRFAKDFLKTLSLDYQERLPQIRKAVDERQKAILTAEPQLDVHLVWFWNMSAETPLGKAAERLKIKEATEAADAKKKANAEARAAALAAAGRNTQ